MIKVEHANQLQRSGHNNPASSAARKKDRRLAVLPALQHSLPDLEPPEQVETSKKR